MNMFRFCNKSSKNYLISSIILFALLRNWKMYVKNVLQWRGSREMNPL